MKRLTLATALAALTLPATALAASSRGVVLSIDSAHHTVQVVDGRHIVHAYHYRGRLPRLHAGSLIRFTRAGKAIAHVKVTSSSSRSVSFYGQVVRSSAHALVLRLADGQVVKFSAKQVSRKRVKRSNRHKRHGIRAHATGASVAGGEITINIQGLQPGVTVLITETVDPAGNVTITITLPSATGPGSGEQQASGVVSGIEEDAFMLQTQDGSDLRLHMAAVALANLGLQDCDTVDVNYHQDAGMLIADTVTSTGTSTSGDCAPDQEPQDVVGTITQVSGSGLTIVTQDQGSMSFTVDSADVTDGFSVGDVVDVTYTDDGSGTLTASDVEFDEQDAFGTVTAVSDGSMTITDGLTGDSETFTADQGLGMFDGVAVGDLVDVLYHASSGSPVADVVVDGGNWGGI